MPLHLHLHRVTVLKTKLVTDYVVAEKVKCQLTIQLWQQWQEETTYQAKTRDRVCHLTKTTLTNRQLCQELDETKCKMVKKLSILTYVKKM